MNNETTGEATPYTPEEPLKITKLVIDGFKRVRHITIFPAIDGLTTIGGANTEGKTSILDAIAFGLLGAEVAPRGSKLINDDAVAIPGSRGVKTKTVIELSDGSVITRKLTEKNNRSGQLDCLLPEGRKGTLEDLKRLISNFSVIPTNMGAMSERDRLKHLLGGVRVDLSDLEELLETINTERQGLFQAKEDCKRHAQDLPEHPGTPVTEVKASETMAELQAAMTSNSANIAKRQDAVTLGNKVAALKDRKESRTQKISDVEAQLKEAVESFNTTEAELVAAILDHNNALAGTADLIDIPTEALQTKLEQTDELNQKIRQNAVRAQKFAEADGLRARWTEKENEQNQAFQAMKDRINDANIPLPGLSIDEKLRVTFDGEIWSDCSSMQHLVIETAIASLYQPNQAFVLADGLEALDMNSQAKFHKWAISQGLQVIGTEVKESYDGAEDDGRCRVIIEDGKVACHA